MSDDARVNIIRSFTGDDDDRLCIKIVSQDENECVSFMTFYDVFYTITGHERYWRCNDTWYPKVHDGVERMMSDIQRDLGLSAAQIKELDQAIADLMIVGE